MKLTTIFAALLFIALGLVLIYFNIASDAKAADVKDSNAAGSYDCRADCDGSCSLSKRINCGGICDTERQEICKFHQQDDDYY